MALLDAFLLTDRTAVVTGAASGIGRATATLFGDAGAHVVLTDISGDALAATTAELRAAGASCEHHLLDVTDRGGFDALVTRIDTERDGLDILVNNAGIITDTSALNVGADELDRVHAVNFRGVVNGSQAAAHAMIPRRRGSIINLVSAAIDGPMPAVVAYSTAKAAAAQFTRSLAMEVGPQGVRVNSVAPGWVDTPLNERHFRDEHGDVDAAAKARYVERRAAGAALGIAGEPMDIAYAILYLASDAARFVTGQVLRPNGGMTMLW